MAHVTGVIETVKIVAWPVFRQSGFQDTRTLEVGMLSKRRRISLAEIDKDQSQIFLRRITLYLYFCRRAFLFPWLLDAPPAPFVLPSMIHAANTVSFHPPGRQL